MKKNLFVKFVFLFALLLVFSPAAFAAAADSKAADAEVEGLWLTCPRFPADAEVLEFENDKEMDMVTYIRGLDGVLTFEIRRQPLAESELREPGDVAELIEMRVYNDDIDEEALKENMDGIDVTEDAEEFAALLTYPCAAAEYTMGANEDTRLYYALFIFTDIYCFEVNISMAADSAGEYNTGRMQEWLSSLELVDSGSGDVTDA